MQKVRNQTVCNTFQVGVPKGIRIRKGKDKFETIKLFHDILVPFAERRIIELRKNIAVIFAGGSGVRMNTRAKPKQFLEMNGKPIIVHTLEYFQNNSDIAGIVISCIGQWVNHMAELAEKYHLDKIVKIVKGGSTGQESIYNGLCAVKELYPLDDVAVLVHDGVRPLITDDLISRNIETVWQYGSAITVTPVTETVVVSEMGGNLQDVIERDNCFCAKAPQTFKLDDILAAHKRAIADGRNNMIDSATLMQSYGYKLHLVEGPVENIKITNPPDFYVFRALYEARENSQIFGI